MSFQSRNSRVLNQEAIDSDIERLVRESPVPQMFFHDRHSNSSNNSFVIPCSRVGRPMSVSAIPKMHAYATASPCAQFAPFCSPQSLNVTYPSNTKSYPSAADIFKSLKNQSRTNEEHSSLDTSQDTDYGSKENDSAAANNVSEREFLMLRNRQPHGNNDRSLRPGGSNLYVENSGIVRKPKDNNRTYCQSMNGLQSSLVQENGYNAGNAGNSKTEFVGKRRQTDESRYQMYRNQAGNSTVDKGNNSYISIDREDNSYSTVDKGDNCYEETFQEAFCDTQKDKAVITERLEECSLYMWIIKPVPGTRNICVEGKKSLNDDTFWHSGVITRRINEKVVETQTRSVYRLEGNMELLDAMAAGFSRKTAEAFWLGFPADWQQLIHDHFNTTQLNSNVEEPSDSEEEITTLEDDGEDSEDTGHEDITLTEVVSADEDDLEPAGTAVVNDNAPVEVTDSPVEKKVPTRKGCKAEVVIENWIVKLLPNGKGIQVLGSKPDSGLLWHSSAVEKRIDKKRLKSSSGSTYRLKGNLDRLLALNEGLPLQIINRFSSGFPKEWQELVQEFMCTKKPREKKSSKSKPKKKRAPVGDRVDKGKKDSTRNKKGTQRGEAAKQETVKVITHRQKVQRDQQEGTGSAKKNMDGNRQRNNTTPIETCKWTKNVLTPNGEMVDLGSLGRSRSGRLIKPPLQWWTGQTLELDGDCVTVKAPTAASSMFLQKFEEGYQKSKHKIKPYWNPREKDKDYSLNTSKSLLGISLSSVETEGLGELKNHNKASSKKVHGARQHSDGDLDPQLKHEVRLILEKTKTKRTKVKQRETCYSGRKHGRANPTDNGNPFDLDETTDLDNTTETEQESSDQDKHRLRSKRQGGNKTKATLKKHGKVEQENVVSSSTGNVDNVIDEADKTEESIACRTLRSRACRKVRTCESDGTNMSSRGNKKQENLENGVRFSQRRKRRILTVIEEDETDTQDEHEEAKDEENTGPLTGSKRKSSGKLPIKNRSSGKKNVKIVETISKPPEIPEIDDHWTKEEKERLKEACKKVSPSNPHYWERVAAEVRTKSVELCREMYYSDQKIPKSAEKKTKKNLKEKVKVTCLTANVGTLKRKQQLRDILEQHNENYSDDLFDSTPYRLTRKRKVPILGEEDDDAIFEELARKQGKSRFETPVAADTMCSRITVPFASTKKTPVSNINVEMLEGSGDADGYVHKILKRRLLAKGKKKAGTPKHAKKIPVEEISPQQKLLFHEYLKEKRDTAENHHDSDHEEDFYWEDETEN